MKKRTSAAILKPVIDEEMALKFAAAGAAPASESDAAKHQALPKPPASNQGSPSGVEKGAKQIQLAIPKGLYAKIAKDAARKNRTVEEHLQRHIAKHYDK